MTRISVDGVELEVDRNVLELMTMLPDPPEVDVHFYRDVWQPQEIQHGRILDEGNRLCVAGNAHQQT